MVGIGIHGGLKIHCSKEREGSNPSGATNFTMSKHTRRHNLTAICLDKKGRVLSVARNSYIKTHPLQAKAAERVGEPERIYLHAEIAAIVKVKDWDKIHTLVINRRNRAGKKLPSKPCKICLSVIEDIGISNVVYTAK